MAGFRSLSFPTCPFSVPTYLRFLPDYSSLASFSWQAMILFGNNTFIKMLVGSATLLVSAYTLPAQHLDSVQTLPTATVAAPTIRQSTVGERQESWDQEALLSNASGHLGELLAGESNVFVKSYGLGSSATTSVRGGSAGHTAVIWNGLPIENPMLGQLDFSLMPVALIDEASLVLGGNTASWGSGAIGGTLFLANKPNFKKGKSLKISSEIGSFGWFNQQLHLRFSNQKWSHRLRLVHQQADNDFEYFLGNGTAKKQSNAAIQQNGLLHELYWKPFPNQQFSIQTWLQETDREIPPTTTQNRSEAEQTDEFWRTAINWKKTIRNSLTTAKAGIFREMQHYQDDLILLNAHNNFWKILGEVEQQWHLNPNQIIQVGTNYTWFEAEADAYKEAMHQNRFAIFFNYHQKIGKLKTQINARQEWVDGNSVPLVPALGLEWPLDDRLNFRTKFTRNYRLPTLNDMFWVPGGNVELQPEKGWSEEVGADILLIPRLQLSYSTTLFNRNIDDWIQWGIREGESFYSANNISKVWSRGIEQRIKMHFNISNVRVTLKGGYDFIRSTYQKASENPKIEVGQQLLYVPKHQAFGVVNLTWNKLDCRYLHNFTGGVSAQNVGQLPSYHIGALRVAYQWVSTSWNAQVFIKTENLWDASYRVVERRPMPGRHFRFGLSFQIK